ncbi:40S ribosomal protein S23 [Gregarina niphandrodes]|uniref:40S ribosomal protein S23 n=1 Tax=Gregarina niphandrodes TaxID=110365 RepID=A0A023B4B6_GRENI|nr:40S ribosomal protein S23 [Gregarina niphandrodes]EZG56674.1 40S ribosomal protein S23 [Gregarina niphandrodes]|eukprot:XP_011131204.1 40S ribosomal protein S23 [Gregarina niphandrodes]
MSLAASANTADLRYPESTSHLRKWIASSRTELQRIKEVFFRRSLVTLIKEKSESSETNEAQQKISSCPITLEKQSDLVAWFVRNLMDIMGAHQFDFRIADTCLAFYTRFYLRESVGRYPPNIYLFTALIMAIKCEDAVGENRSPSRLFNGMGKTTAFHEALGNEAILCQAIQFDFRILHGDAPLTHLVNSYYGFRKKNRLLTVPAVNFESRVAASRGAGTATGEKPAAGEEEIFVEWLGQLQTACEKLYLQLYASDTHFLFRPAEVATGVFRHVLKTRYQLADADDFLTNFLNIAAKGDPEAAARLRKTVDHTAHEAYKQETFMASYNMDYWRPKIQEYLKEARKWARQLERKRPLDATLADAKRNKAADEPRPDPAAATAPSQTAPETKKLVTEAALVSDVAMVPETTAAAPAPPVAEEKMDAQDTRIARGIKCARKLRTRRKTQKWADKAYKKVALGSRWKYDPFQGSSHAKGIVVERLGIEAKQPNSASRKCVRVQLVKSGKKITAFVPRDGSLNYIEENDLVLVSGFGRSGHAVGDIPGVRFKIVKVAGVSLLALFKEKIEKPRA